MQVVRVILFIVYVPLFCELQYTSQIYPDPRFDAFSCKIVVPGPLCDPDDIINFGDKNALIDRINEVHLIQKIFANPVKSKFNK